jgi:hypothetical protein
MRLLTLYFICLLLECGRNFRFREYAPMFIRLSLACAVGSVNPIHNSTPRLVVEKLSLNLSWVQRLCSEWIDTMCGVYFHGFSCTICSLLAVNNAEANAIWWLPLPSAFHGGMFWNSSFAAQCTKRRRTSLLERITGTDPCCIYRCSLLWFFLFQLANSLRLAGIWAIVLHRSPTCAVQLIGVTAIER